MAGDWIKMRTNLWDDPRVSRLCDLTGSSEAAVIGGLYWLWAMADDHTEDGILPGLTTRAVDRKTGVQGLGAALVSIGWVEEQDDGLRIVGFEEHNGTSAKRRCMEAQRKANSRKESAQDPQPEGSASASHADNSRTDSGDHAELEKRREEKNKEEGESKPPRAPRKPSRTPMPDDFDISDRVKEWAKEKGYENLGAHLEAFKAKVHAKGYQYVNWDSAFMEAIREDWAKLRGQGAARGQAPPPERAAHPWWETGPGIRAKGKELGIGDWKEGAEQWHPYADTVFKAAKARGELPDGVRL